MHIINQGFKFKKCKCIKYIYIYIYIYCICMQYTYIVYVCNIYIYVYIYILYIYTYIYIYIYATRAATWKFQCPVLRLHRISCENKCFNVHPCMQSGDAIRVHDWAQCWILHAFKVLTIALCECWYFRISQPQHSWLRGVLRPTGRHRTTVFTLLLDRW